MNDKTEKLKQQILADETKITLLQEGVKAKKIKLKEMENAQIMNNINVLHAKGIDVKKIIEAIKNNDEITLMKYMGCEKESKNNE